MNLKWYERIPLIVNFFINIFILPILAFDGDYNSFGKVLIVIIILLNWIGYYQLFRYLGRKI